MKVILLIFSTVFLLSCGSNKEGGLRSEDGIKVSQRDYSITPENSYSNLFFDSLHLMKYLEENKVSDSLAHRIISFYNTRNYQYAWFTSNGFTEQARGFWNLHDYEMNYGTDTSLQNKQLEKSMSALMAGGRFSVKSNGPKHLQIEFTLTKHLIQYALNNIEEGYIKRKELESFVPRKKADPMQLADSLLNRKNKDGKYYEDVNEPYRKLKEKLKDYYNIANTGGWPQVPSEAAKLKPGDSSMQIVALKKRLRLTGDLPADDTSAAFDDNLVKGISNFQNRFSLTPTGKLSESLIKEMNVPVTDRIRQILINLGRTQWLIHQPEGQLILVNIPEFKLHVFEEEHKVFDINVVVGKQGHNTTLFTGNLNQVVFSPYWNIPSSIVKNEILPAMQSNPGYLDAQNMEITQEGEMPVIRQRPGPGNALGKVKFLFPNTYNIYFHDTPAKSLFGRDKRAFSHGCIRLEEPAKLAEYLLQGEDGWTPAKIRAAMNAGTEKVVVLKKPVPVLITYYTAWVDDLGRLRFAGDIYGHDKSLLNRMFL